MNDFIKFYRWGINMKFHMSLYCIALIFFAGGTRLLLGETTISIWTLFEMLITCLVFAIIESFCFPIHKDISKKQLQINTLIWFGLANVIFISSSYFFGWFTGIPMWGVIILLMILEGGLIAMWYAVFLQKIDTRQLNHRLRKFQNK